jgi:putative tail protein
MIGASTNSAIKPSALGITANSSTYGSTIPVVFGRMRGAVYLIWCANIRSGPSNKKGKGGGSGSGSASSSTGPPTYVANVDMLIGHNPMAAVLQCWNNNQTKLGMNFVEYTVSAPCGLTGDATITFEDNAFYCVLAVTVDINYSAAVNDYGGTGPQTLAGTYEAPLWNAVFQGPDPTNPSGYRNYPMVYVWEPGTGPTVTIPQLQFGCFLNGAPGDYTHQTVHIYYAQIQGYTGFVAGLFKQGNSPLAQLRLSFESVLGNGPEFDGFDTSGAALSTFRILYPHYVGVGSTNFDLGSSGLGPVTRLEMLGAYPVYPSGDADFPDMVEDIFKQGVSQAGLGTQTFSTIQRGLGASNYPGAVQQKMLGTFESNANALSFDLPVTAGNILVAYYDGDTAGPLTLSDSAGNTWVQAATGTRFAARTFSYGLWYCVNCLAGANTVTFGATGFYANDFVLLELAGLDTFDSFASAVPGVSPQVAVTTTNPPGQAGLILAFGFCQGDAVLSTMNPGQTNLWPVILGPITTGGGSAIDYGGDHDGLAWVQQRVVSTPGTYPLSFQKPSTYSDSSYLLLLAFKQSQPAAYPKALGNILDDASMQLTRAQCRANRLYGSLIMDTQQAASDWLAQLYTAMNAAPVWSGFQLKSIPYSEVSAAGNGAIYIPPTAAGPVANLGPADFIGDASGPLITIERKAQVDVPNLLQIQHPNRASDYNDVVESQPETGAIALYGPRKASPQNLRCVQDTITARKILGIQVRRQNYLRDTYKFKLNAKWKLLEPMDLITLTDPLMGLAAVPVRLTSLAEDNQFALDCEAEPFIYGVSDPGTLTGSTAPLPYQPNSQSVPASVNAPIFLEPVPRLANNLSQLWVVVSDADPIYGGCVVYLSTDGGNSYNPVGTLVGSAITGVTTADWPADTDPDTTNDLALDLSESNGVLLSYQVADEDNFTYPCFVAGGVTGGGGGGTSIDVPTLVYDDMTGLNQGHPHGVPSDYDFYTGPVINMGNSPAGSLALEWWGALYVGPTGNPATNTFVNVRGCELLWLRASTGVWNNSVFAFSDIGSDEFSEDFVTDYDTPVTMRLESDGSFSFLTVSGQVAHFYAPFPRVSIDPTDLGGIVCFCEARLILNNPAGVDDRALASFLLGIGADYYPTTTGPGIEDNPGVGGGKFKYVTESWQAFAMTTMTLAELQANPPPIDVSDLSSGGAVVASGSIPYELMTYALANLTAVSKYTLKATGGGTNHLRRAVFGAPAVGVGVDHPSASRWAFLSPAGTGILKLALDPSWIGTTVYFKFCAFNAFAAGAQALSAVAAYPYTPIGVAVSQQSPDYTIVPQIPLSQLSAGHIAMAQVTAQFSNNTANYNPRSWSILPIEGAGPDFTFWYYVTIFDPGYLGDTGAQTNLPSYVETSTAKVGVPGYTYMGAILMDYYTADDATPLPGGWPTPQGIVVGP